MYLNGVYVIHPIKSAWQNQYVVNVFCPTLQEAILVNGYGKQMCEKQDDYMLHMLYPHTKTHLKTPKKNVEQHLPCPETIASPFLQLFELQPRHDHLRGRDKFRGGKKHCHQCIAGIMVMKFPEAINKLNNNTSIKQYKYTFTHVILDVFDNHLYYT